MRLSHVAASIVAIALVISLTPAAVAQENILRAGINADGANLDPHRATSTTDKTLVGWMFNGLVRFPPGSAEPSDIEPDLAESWTVSDNGLEWTFKLREGVKFHGDYGVLTSADVVYSLNRAKNPDTSSFAGAYSAVQSVEAVDDLTVKITLAYPVPAFLGLIANYHGGNIVSMKAAEQMGADFNAHPIGTGPFEFNEWVTQQHVALDANPDYFRGAPKLDGIVLQFIPSDSSRELAFQSGELDVVYGKREQVWVESARSIPRAVVDIFSPGEFRTLHLNQTMEPFDDVLVRQAVAHAINVDDIVAFVGADVALKGCSVIPPGYLGEDCSAWTYDFDVAKAKELLTQAGLPDGFTFSAVVSSNAAQQPIMEIIQAQLADVGIRMEMNIVDHPTYHEQIRADLSGAVFYGSARFPVADSYLTEYYHSDAIVGKETAITNFSHCDVADAEIEAARRATTDEARLAAWSEAQRKIHETVCAVPLFSLQQVWVRSEAVDYGYTLLGAMNLAPPITELTTVAR